MSGSQFTVLGFFLFALIAVGMWGCPQYNVYSARLSGTAAIQKAEEQKLVLIEDARARMEAAKMDAEAEIIRAKGMAEAMAIENGQLTAEYNQYLFIRTLEDMGEQGNLPIIIYLPSEGMLPVMDVNSHGNLIKPNETLSVDK